MTGCACDPAVPPEPFGTGGGSGTGAGGAGGGGWRGTANPPGQDRLRRRVTTHGQSLARMRADLAGGVGRPPGLRTLARHPSDDPLVALLDTWAVVTDVVAFYSERIAEEGYLRTATERRSLRELARTLGHELRPGVAAQAELALEAETAPGAPKSVHVARGTPVQSIPGQDELPQVFETSADIEIRGVWNRLPVRAEQDQLLMGATDEIWLRGPTSVRPGDTVLVAPAVGDGGVGLRGHRDVRGGGGAGGGVLLRRDGSRVALRRDARDGRDVVIGGGVIVDPREPIGPIDPRDPIIGGGGGGVVTDPGTPDEDDSQEGRDVRVVVEVVSEPDGLTGWTLLRLDALTSSFDAPREVHAFTSTARVFGHNAPDPSLLVTEKGGPPGSSGPPATTTTTTAGTRPVYTWDGINDYGETVDLDGDHPGVLAGGWIVLEGDRETAALQVVNATATGLAKWALAGPVTAVEVDAIGAAAEVPPRTAKVHCASVPLAADTAPVTAPTDPAVATLEVPATDPLLPVDRAVLVVGSAAGEQRADLFTVTAAAGSGPWTTLTLDRPLGHAYDLAGLEVRGNVVTATHGESVAQALGSGDGRTPFVEVRPRRAPLTYVRAPAPPGAPPGARAELVVRVDGVAWTEVASLADAGPTDRVYVVRHEEDAPPRIVFGDGVHGALPPTGVENIRAEYRVGLGEAGAVRAGQLALLPRRPLGTRAVTNPGAAHDWAPAETLEDARTGAPLLVRNLGRIVSVADHADFARTYAGVGRARADAVWDGRRSVVVLTVLGVGGAEPSTSLLTDLETAVLEARYPAVPVVVHAAEVLGYAVHVDLEHDPAHERDVVEAAVVAALTEELGPAARELTQGATAAEALLAIRSVPGVLACTMPRLTAEEQSDDATDARTDVLGALAARWDPDHDVDPIRPAQLRALEGVTIGEMT